MTNAPGWLSPEANRIIVEHTYSCVPDNGTVLELGSMFGATTQIISKHINPTSRIFVIDWWQGIPISEIYKMKRHSAEEHRKFFDKLISQDNNKNNISGDTFYDWWKYFTKDLHNVTHFRDNVINVPKHKIPEVDLIIQDAQHHYEGVLAELKYWWPKLKPGGTLILDDYNKRSWPGVVQAAEEFFSNNRYETKVPTDSSLLIVKKGK